MTRTSASGVILRLAAVDGEGIDDDESCVGWPEALGDVAYHGVAGRIVRAIEPHTEADPAGLLISLLVAFGNCVDRSPHFMVERTKHYTNEFAVMVGRSSQARKGTMWDQVRELLRIVCEQDNDPWTSRIKGGLSSGEGLIVQVQDPKDEDEEAPDKRLMIVEAEFAKVLTVIRREGNTLSSIIREAWDKGDIRTLTKMPVEATDAHISMIAHITVHELKRLLNSQEMASGFANRMLFVAVRRSKELPFGGKRIDFEPFANELRNAKRFAQDIDQMKMSGMAKAHWGEGYSDLTRERAGLIGDVTARGAPHVLRLAMIYALLDQSELIRPPHLHAALEVWRYCKDSAEYIFGGATGDSIADRILSELIARHPQGMKRKEISALFAGNKSSSEIEMSLAFLKGNKLAKDELVRTSGRPAEVWFAKK